MGSIRKNKRAKACAISDNARKEVNRRDGIFCAACECNQGRDLAHFISRAHGGLGIPSNLAKLCGDCHYTFDHGTKEQREAIRKRLRAYLMEQYPGWSEENLIYRKWG